MKTVRLFCSLLLIVGTGFAYANPPYDLVVQQPGTASTGGQIDTYELWENCDSTPQLVDADVVVPETYTGILPSDGTYNYCIRGRNARGLAPIGLVIDVNVFALQAPGPVDGGTVIGVECPNGPCTFTITPRSLNP